MVFFPAMFPFRRVPQSSILEPTLCLITVSDLSDSLKNQLSYFSNDSTLYKIIHIACEWLAAAETLFSDLDKISHWSPTWNMISHSSTLASHMLSHHLSTGSA